MTGKNVKRPLVSTICSACRPRGISTSSSIGRPIWRRITNDGSNLRASVKRRHLSTDALKLNYAVLPGRSLILLDGPDATNFLHNLIPAPVLPLTGKSSCIASAFLNAKGRILHDVFVYKPSKDDEEKWCLEVDTNSAPLVVKHLNKHKLRSKFKLRQLSPDEAQVFYLWPRSAVPKGSQGLALYQDPRPKMGTRGYVTGEHAPQTWQQLLEGHKEKEEYHWEDYMIHRMLNGHAEGPVEIPYEHALPQESNLDFYGGIDFQKGCYLGQELTIRTHHTGVVRKRILPVQIYAEANTIPTDQTRPMYDPVAALPQPPNQANITKSGGKGRSGRSTGRWMGGYGNIGLALCRLETMTDLSLTAEGSQLQTQSDTFEVSWHDETSTEDKKVKVKAFVPPWLRQAIEASIKARSDRAQTRKGKDADEDDEIDVA